MIQATRSRMGLDWRARHHPIHAVLNNGLALVAGATVLQHVSLGGWNMALTGTAVLAVALFTALAVLLAGKGAPRALGAGVLIVASGAWVLVARVDPWSPVILGVLVVAVTCAAIGAMAWRRRNAGKTVDPVAQIKATLTSRGGELAEQWRQRIARVMRVEGRVVSLHEWPTRTGFTVTFQPAEGGTTANEFAMAASRLAADARLPKGCGVEVEVGEHRGEVVLRVSTVNAMVKEKPYLIDAAPRSIYDPLPVGVRRDGTPSTVALKFASMALAGQKGSGKTNRLHVLTAQLAACTDVLVWHVDLTGGLSLPWVQPWLDKRAAAPGVDWVATTVEEAQRMVDVGLAIVRGRKPAYRDRMRMANDDKLPIDAGVPQIVVIVDEFASLPRTVQTAIIKLSDEGRGPGVQTVVCALRGTSDYLPKELLVQAANRISMRGSSEAEHAHVMGWAARLEPAEVPYEGCGFVLSAEDFLGAPVPDRAYRITPKQVDAVVVSTAARRPRLDEVSVRLAEDFEVGAYRQRWARLLAEGQQIRDEGRAKLDAAMGPARADAVVRQRLERAVAANPGQADPHSWAKPQGVVFQRSPAHELMLAALREALPQGLQPGQLHKRLTDGGHSTTRQTVQDWLALEMSRGTVRQPVDRGPYYAVPAEPATGGVSGG